MGKLTPYQLAKNVSRANSTVEVNQETNKVILKQHVVNKSIPNCTQEPGEKELIEYCTIIN